MNERPAQACWLGLWLLVTLGLTGGCSRDHYRTQADTDVYHLIGKDTQDPRWSLPGFTIQPDPRSRMFDPNSPDYPPMPPDDPTAHEFMHCVDCKKGYPCWGRNGHTPFVQNPDWKHYVPIDEEGRLSLDMRGAVSAALLNSPDYQRQLEELYLSALDVSFEQFRFDTQFFGGYEAFFTTIGEENSAAPGGPSNELRLSTRDIEMRKMFAHGGELVVGLANSLIWEFTGKDNHTAFTMLDFSFVQPLLRGGGRARVLERLTISERALLANVRQLERFRRGFYAEVATGIDAGGGPSRRGGLGGGAGLEGFSGVGAGGFGRLGSITTGGRTGTGAAQAGGYLGLLQTAQEIRNLQANTAALASSLAELQAKYDAGGRIDFFQVELARQALYNAQSLLLTRRTAYQSDLEAYKVELGLPPDTPLRLSDPILERFNLIDDDLTAAQTEATELLNRIRDPDLELTEASWSELLSQAERLVASVSEQVNVADRDVERFLENLPARRANLHRLADRPEVRSGEVNEDAFDVSRLDSLAELAIDFLGKLKGRQRDLVERFERIQTPSEREQLKEIVSGLNLVLGEILLLQARARLEAVALRPVQLNAPTALEIARNYRRDWMNARAALVDAWRLIEFNANDLKSDLDVVFNGDIQNVRDNPFNLQGSAGRLQVGLEFDAPLTRLVERNNYRQSLIEYQQARRNYYTFEDRVYQSLRNTLRNVELNQLNFELRRAAVQLAISQVELARLQLEEPPRPGTETGPIVGGSDNRVQNLVNALSELLNSQNDFLSIWANYEVLRLTLDFQLGTMELDQEGLWIDPGDIDIGSIIEHPDETIIEHPDEM